MIAVIDYGMGNIQSIVKALEYVGASVTVAQKPEQIIDAEKIVVPGVGAFRDGMAALRTSGLDNALKAAVLEKKKPFLGICLGMQLLADTSFEFGSWDGLGWVPGVVERFTVDERFGLRVPHTGWNTVRFEHDHPVFKNIPAESDFYFVHSYHVKPNDSSVVAAHCDYGEPFVAAIVQDNIIATQFHPEKSQRVGLQLLENFVAWQPYA